jgi:hypothetical protein
MVGRYFKKSPFFTKEENLIKERKAEAFLYYLPPACCNSMRLLRRFALHRSGAGLRSSQ